MKQNHFSSIHRVHCAVQVRAIAWMAALFLAIGSTALANNPTPSPTPTPTPTPRPRPKLRVTVDTRPLRFQEAQDAILDTRSPSNPANLTQDAATTRIVDRLQELQTGSGSAGPDGKEAKDTTAPNAPLIGNFTRTMESHSYLPSNDKRQVDMDTITNSGSGGFDFTIGKTLVGLIYYYGHSSGSSNFLHSNTATDSNFVSLYAAQPITNWLSAGVTAGYGHSDIFTSLRHPSSSQGSDTDSWSASPFFSLVYAKDNFYTSLTTTYQYLHTDADDSNQLNIMLAAGYHFNGWLQAEVSGKFSQVLHNTSRGIPEDDQWYSVGPKLTEHITPKLSIYEAYQFMVNDSFTDHVITGGVAYSF